VQTGVRYSTFPEIQEYIGANKAQFEGSSASEVLAHLIITSEPFKRFLQRLEEKVSLELDANWLSQMITGQLKKSLSGLGRSMLISSIISFVTDTTVDCLLG